MNLSSLSKTMFLAIGVAVMALISIIDEIVLGERAILLIVLMIITLALAVGVVLMCRKVVAAVAQMTVVCKAIDRGDFESRVIGITEKGDLGELMYAINDAVDRADAFFGLLEDLERLFERPVDLVRSQRGAPEAVSARAVVEGVLEALADAGEDRGVVESVLQTEEEARAELETLFSDPREVEKWLRHMPLKAPVTA